jgi:hypothetical protein
MRCEDAPMTEALTDKSAHDELTDALNDGASALNYRADKLRDVADDDAKALAMVETFRHHAAILARLALDSGFIVGAYLYPEPPKSGHA